MAKTAEHSKIPWKVDSRVGCIAVYPESEEYNCLDIPQINFVGYWSGYRTNGENNTRWATHEKDKANAEFIVRAANSFYPMLEALKRIKDKTSNQLLYHDGIKSWGDIQKEYTQVAVAIKEAEDEG